MAEWFKAAVLKTVERKFRGFESYLLRHTLQFQSFAGFEAERTLTECQKSGQEARGRERRGADAGTGRMPVTEWANPTSSAIHSSSKALQDSKRSER